MSAGQSISHRKESRVYAVLPVKVSPHDQPAKVRAACTCEISARGARLMKVDGIGEGDVLWISRHTRRAKFKVLWIGKPGSDLDGKIGVESLEPDKFIWDDDLRSRLA
jgi:hypothetical protein